MMDKFWKGFEKAAAAGIPPIGKADGMASGVTNFLKGKSSLRPPSFSYSNPAGTRMPKVKKAPKRYKSGKTTTPI